MTLPLKSGTLLHNRYLVKRIIGQGGMGCIYLAEDSRLEGRQCALKEVEHDKSLPSNLVKEARQQFFREASILARLDHPNLPKVSDFFSHAMRDYLVMDYIPGKDLRTLLLAEKEKNTFLSENEVIGWANQLADALSYMHNQNPSILHRDIKPSNLKLTPTGFLKLVDFGLVKVLAPGEMTITVLQGQGTAIYTPLEQIGGDSGHTDARTDIYAFGATLYHLLTNHPPVEARERFLDSDALVPPRQINPALSHRTERAILWAMSLHPNERPESVQQFRESLNNDRDANQKLSPLRKYRLKDYLKLPIERTMLFVAIALFFISLLISFLG